MEIWRSKKIVCLILIIAMNRIWLHLQTDCSAVLTIQRKHRNRLKNKRWREASVPYELHHTHTSWVFKTNLSDWNSFVKGTYSQIMFSVFRSKSFYCCDSNIDGMRGQRTKFWWITSRERFLGACRRRFKMVLMNIYVISVNLRTKFNWFRTGAIGSLFEQ
jgi:hypothetical protein